MAAARYALGLGADGLPAQVRPEPLALPAFTVALLPTTGNSVGALAFATNGRALTGGILGLLFVVETAGNGTGCLVSWNGTAWKIAGTNITVTA